jgi:hypothetical protein
MKRFFAILVFPLFVLSANAQSYSFSYEQYYSRFLKYIDTVNTDRGDFQIRLWFNNGGNRINTTYLLSLGFTNQKWVVQNLSFTTFPLSLNRDSVEIGEREPLQLNYDSLYSQLLDDSLFMLSSNIDYTPANKNNLVVWADAGPTNYTIEILTASQREVLNFKCPRFYYTQYNREALKMPLKIISSLLKVMNLPFQEPC